MAALSRGRRALPWLAAGAVALIGAVIAAIGAVTPASFGWFAYQPLAGDVFLPGDAMLLSRTFVIGLAVLAIGLIGLAFLAGCRVGNRSRKG